MLIDQGLQHSTQQQQPPCSPQQAHTADNAASAQPATLAGLHSQATAQLAILAQASSNTAPVISDWDRAPASPGQAAVQPQQVSANSDVEANMADSLPQQYGAAQPVPAAQLATSSQSAPPSIHHLHRASTSHGQPAVQSQQAPQTGVASSAEADIADSPSQQHCIAQPEPAAQLATSPPSAASIASDLNRAPASIGQAAFQPQQLLQTGQTTSDAKADMPDSSAEPSQQGCSAQPETASRDGLLNYGAGSPQQSCVAQSEAAIRAGLLYCGAGLPDAYLAVTVDELMLLSQGCALDITQHAGLTAGDNSCNLCATRCQASLPCRLCSTQHCHNCLLRWHQHRVHLSLCTNHVCIVNRALLHTFCEATGMQQAYPNFIASGL